jgi:polyisoprenoid-binding protein YceI
MTILRPISAALSVFALLCLLLCGTSLQAQSRFKITKSRVAFTSNAPLELIKASSTSLRGALDPATGKFAFALKINTFQGFNSELQRQHFNENYLESETYPEATFTGKIIETIDYTQDGTHEVRAKGKLTIHGVDQVRLFRATITIKNGVLSIAADLAVPLEDHDISIPTIVSQKIATEIAVEVRATLTAG